MNEQNIPPLLIPPFLPIFTIMSTHHPKQSHLQLKSLFDLLYLRLCRFADLLIADSAMAEDIVQKVFINYECEDDDFPAIKMFLYKEVLNACQEHKATVKTAFLRAEVGGEINRAIAALPEGCGKVFKLSYVEELKNEEIAAEMSMPVSWVKTQKARAQELLHWRLKPETFLVLNFFLSIAE
ncbi:RNA polymerase sigma-70 factor, ECF subfamily [Chitinophaga ginsengisegetis]|uniref:RNA polymerase sigma-70 factor, ECF subfamily n=2 Tax=Chitinophagaceae TaxID=563835 RepID=A0A1T5P846_9BACT|nr:RNA polymerase sigma-70 factor, ECF subfamily [Chitinophaga ginsengisegetis]